MKLINLLKLIIVENQKIQPTIKKENESILVYQSEHQAIDRAGAKPLTTTLIDKISQGKYHSGVNSRVIFNSIENNFYKIYDNMIDEIENTEDNRLIFVDKFELDSDYYIEYVLAGDKINESTLKVVIVTSAYSTDKKYFKDVKKYNTKLVALAESINLNKLKIIHLF